MASQPEQQDRWVTLPMCHKRTFTLYSARRAGRRITLHAGNPTTVASVCRTRDRLLAGVFWHEFGGCGDVFKTLTIKYFRGAL